MNYLSESGLERLVSNIKVYVENHGGTLSGITLDGVPQGVVDKVCYLNMSAYAKKSDITSVMDFKGTITGSGLHDLTDMKKGDVYAVTEDGSSYKAHSEYVYDGTEWRELGPISNELATYDSTIHRFSSGVVSGTDFNSYASFIETMGEPDEITTAFIDSLFN